MAFKQLMVFKTAKRAQPTATKKRPLTRNEFNQRLMVDGFIARLHDPSLDIDDDEPDDPPVTIKGEPFLLVEFYPSLCSSVLLGFVCAGV